MNSAPTDNHAAGTAVRGMRTVARAALACALVFSGGLAFAQQGGDRRDDQQQHQQASRERFTLPQQQQQDRGRRDADPRSYDDAHRPQQSQYQPPQQAQQQPQREDPRRPSGRLTPDERRDLRRQINEAGQDLYPRRN